MLPETNAAPSPQRAKKGMNSRETLSSRPLSVTYLLRCAAMVLDENPPPQQMAMRSMCGPFSLE